MVFNGMRIYENPLLTVSQMRVLSWRERLTSWPWRPWVKTRTWQAPDPEVYVFTIPSMFGGPVMKGVFVHPETAKALRRESDDE